MTCASVLKATLEQRLSPKYTVVPPSGLSMSLALRCAGSTFLGIAARNSESACAEFERCLVPFCGFRALEQSEPKTA